jgi:hypothetical protein
VIGLSALKLATIATTEPFIGKFNLGHERFEGVTHDPFPSREWIKKMRRSGDILSEERRRYLLRGNKKIQPGHLEPSPSSEAKGKREGVNEVI